MDGDDIPDVASSRGQGNDVMELSMSHFGCFIMFLDANGLVKSLQIIDVNNRHGGFLADDHLGQTANDGGECFHSFESTTTSTGGFGSGMGSTGFSSSSSDSWFCSFGEAVASAGDLDYDGVPDLLVGMPKSSWVESGQVYLLYLTTEGRTRSFTSITSITDGLTADVVGIDVDGAGFGFSLTCVDVNHDNSVDVISGFAPYHLARRIFVVFLDSNCRNPLLNTQYRIYLSCVVTTSIGNHISTLFSVITLNILSLSLSMSLFFLL